MTQPARRQPFVLSLLLSAMLLSGQALAGVSDQDILQDPKNPEQVVTNGLGVQGQRYSPLDILNVDNVKELRPAWAFSFGGEKQRGQQAQPMVKDGVMYMTGSYSRVFAVDARTGKKLWQYDARLPDDIRPCCDVINRGVALYGDLVIFGTLDAKLVALNKDTGKVVWSKKVADHKEGYSISAAPLVINGKLITGVAGGEFGVVGKIEAYDPKNGDLLWTRPTVEGHMGYIYKDGKAVENGISGGEAGKTWPGDLWKPAARPLGSVVTTTRKPTCCCSAPATRRRGTRTCALATTSTRHRAWRSTRTTAPSSGTSRAPPTMVGTTTA